MNRYLLDHQFPQVIAHAGLSVREVLRQADLPADLFARRDASVSSPEYMRLLDAIATLSGRAGLAVELATLDDIEQFNPVIFASYCAHDGEQFLQRIAQLKPLIAPVRYRVEVLGSETCVYIDSDALDTGLSAFIAEGELAFIIHVLRRATRQHIRPVVVESSHPVSPALRELADSVFSQSGVNAVTFRTADLQLRFVWANDGMWNFFEPELRRRLHDLEIDDTMAARVRTALVELLPVGRGAIEDVARTLNMSARTIQRRLTAEDTSFRKQLNHVRLLLAKQYLGSTTMGIDSIAFMLGYTETTSFVRAFSTWEGHTPAQYRAALDDRV